MSVDTTPVTLMPLERANVSNRRRSLGVKRIPNFSDRSSFMKKFLSDYTLPVSCGLKKRAKQKAQVRICGDQGLC
jgi:hypothetical protein